MTTCGKYQQGICNDCTDFSRKIFLMLYSFNSPNFIVFTSRDIYALELLVNQAVKS